MSDGCYDCNGKSKVLTHSSSPDCTLLLTSPVSMVGEDILLLSPPAPAANPHTDLLDKINECIVYLF